VWHSLNAESIDYGSTANLIQLN